MALELMREALVAQGVRAEIVTRRDDFASPQMRWFVACLNQISRPLDRRNMAVVMQTFEDFASSQLDWGSARITLRNRRSESAGELDDCCARG